METFIAICGSLLGLALLGLLIYGSFYETTSVHFGIVYFLGGRTKRILKEGPGWILPWFNTVKEIPTKLQPLPFEVEFTTLDQVKLKVGGSIEYKASSRICDSDGTNKYVAVSDESRSHGLITAIKGLLSNLGGIHNSDDFRGHRETLQLMLRCIMELENLPHIEGLVSSPQMFQWYQENALAVSQTLKNSTNSFSEIEMLYGIEIATVKLGEVIYPQQIEDAQQDKRETQLRGEAVDSYITQAKKIRDELGVSGEQAWRGAISVMKPGVDISVAEGDPLANIIDALRGRKT